MWLVLCASHDEAAKWAYQGLQERGPCPVELVKAGDLAFGVTWEHRLGVEGNDTRIKLADGRQILNREVRGVLNRLTYAPADSLLLISPGDRDYVTQELNTFFMSWLLMLPGPMLNRPSPQGLSGRWRHLSEWIWLAARAGLPTPTYKRSSHDTGMESEFHSRAVPAGVPVKTLIVVDDRVVGEGGSAALREGCLRLAKLSGSKILGVEFSTDKRDLWTFAGATTLPDLRLGGTALLDALAEVFYKRTERER